MTHRTDAIDFEGTPVPFEAGDTVLSAVLRAGIRPWGGCLCTEGDCPHCLVTVGGVSYLRACGTAAVDAMQVRSHPPDGYPPLPSDVRQEDPAAQTVHCDTVVIGQGRSGRAAATEAEQSGRRVVTLDAGAGRHAVGVYPGLEVVAHTPAGMRRIFCDEVVVATGTAEIQPVCPGNQLAGILTKRAAERLAATRVDLGRIVAVGVPPEGIDHEHASGRLIRFEGEGSIRAVVTFDEASGAERTYPCDTAVVGLGSGPRDTLARMASGLPGVRSVGGAAGPLDRPPVPERGIVCPCSGVTVDDLRSVWDRGFRELELIKRSTLAGTGVCQGMACMPHVRSYVAAAAGAELPPSFTARPVASQITMGEAAAGWYLPAYRRTALHEEHLALGAVMERSGGWYRPWTYGDPDREYWAVRSGVSICDVSTLGKFLVSGPDAEAFLERIYPSAIAPIRSGRSKYVLMLDERGYVFDDGLVCRDTATRFLLTSTSAGAAGTEMWLRDWAEAWAMDVRILERTASWGAINVTGPRSSELLQRLGVDSLPPFMGHGRTRVAGVECRVMRMSFTGEISYELHHPASGSVSLWRALMQSGDDLDVWPHGLEVLEELRLEKGHILVGVDSISDSTPRRLGHEWAVRMDEGEFVGRRALARTSRLPLDKSLVGLEIEGAAPPEGSILRAGDAYAGFVTSSAYSRVLGKSVMLAWLYTVGGELVDEVTIGNRTARRVPVPFYDAQGHRVRA